MKDDSSNLLARWCRGDEEAAGELFRRYGDRLIGLAQTRMSSLLKRRVDAEDVVQSVYRSFFASAREGRYQLQRGGDLWRLLVVITLQKLRAQVEHHTAQKRGLRREQSLGDDDGPHGVQAMLQGRAPTPEDALVLAEELELMMSKLEPLERQMLELRLQGHNLEEIAKATRRSERTVTRVLKVAKDLLEDRRRE